METDIISIAKSFLGEEEIRGNQGFKSEFYQELMTAAGWKKGEAWCSYATEIIWRLHYALTNSLIERQVNLLFNASAVKTFKNFKKAGWYVNSGTNPLPGSLVIWQKYKDGVPYWQGHAGIFEEIHEHGFYSIEGNTNDNGSREGYKNCRKFRTFDYYTITGLRLLGFIEPKEI